MTGERDYLIGLSSAIGVDLPPEDADRLILYLDELLRWNRKINLTAITDRREALTKHLVDSLAVVPFLAGTASLLDVGSGAGLPAIPLAITLPSLAVEAIDAVEKKISFQRHAARLLRLQNFSAGHVRVEKLAGKTFDAIISRAFSDVTSFCRVALPLLAPGGTIIAMKGKEGEREAAEAQEEIRAMGAYLAEVRKYTLPGTGDGRSLLFIRSSSK